MMRRIAKRRQSADSASKPDSASQAMEIFTHDITASMLFFAKQYSVVSGRNACDFDESDIDAAMKMPGNGKYMPVSWLYCVRKSVTEVTP